MESRESVINELRMLGVKINQILVYHPTDKQLIDMRNGLVRLRKQ